MKFGKLNIRKRGVLGYTMEGIKRDNADGREKDIAYSRSVKAGKRIYYLDVKRSKNNDLYLSLTESKKKVSGDASNQDVSYEKHKIFLYREDLSKFTDALIDVIKYMQQHDGRLQYGETDEDVSGLSADGDAYTNELNDREPPIKLDLDDFV